MHIVERSEPPRSSCKECCQHGSESTNWVERSEPPRSSCKIVAAMMMQAIESSRGPSPLAALARCRGRRTLTRYFKVERSEPPRSSCKQVTSIIGLQPIHVERSEPPRSSCKVLAGYHAGPGAVESRGPSPLAALASHLRTSSLVALPDVERSEPPRSSCKPTARADGAAASVGREVRAPSQLLQAWGSLPLRISLPSSRGPSPLAALASKGKDRLRRRGRVERSEPPRSSCKGTCQDLPFLAILFSSARAARMEVVLAPTTPAGSPVLSGFSAGATRTTTSPLATLACWRSVLFTSWSQLAPQGQRCVTSRRGSQGSTSPQASQRLVLSFASTATTSQWYLAAACRILSRRSPALASCLFDRASSPCWSSGLSGFGRRATLRMSKVSTHTRAEVVTTLLATHL